MRKYVFLQSIITDSQNISIDLTVAINVRYKSTRPNISRGMTGNQILWDRKWNPIFRNLLWIRNLFFVIANKNVTKNCYSNLIATYYQELSSSSSLFPPKSTKNRNELYKEHSGNTNLTFEEDFCIELM